MSSRGRASKDRRQIAVFRHRAHIRIRWPSRVFSLIIAIEYSAPAMRLLSAKRRENGETQTQTRGGRGVGWGGQEDTAEDTEGGAAVVHKG
jgi:hypothetical protein